MSTNINIFYVILVLYILSLIYKIYKYGFTGYLQRRVDIKKKRWDKVDQAIGLK